MAVVVVVVVVAVLARAAMADRSYHHDGHDCDLGLCHGSRGMQPP
jgi:hypothetical protein